MARLLSDRMARSSGFVMGSITAKTVQPLNSPMGAKNRYYLHGEEWEDGASVLARQKAEKDRPKKRPPQEKTALPTAIQTTLELIGR